MHRLILDGETLDLPSLIWATFDETVKVEVAEKAWHNLQRSYENLKRSVNKGTQIYGVTTGVGANERITLKESERLNFQEKIIKSHSVGVGSNVPKDIVRATLILKINSLIKGYSGVRKEIVEYLTAFLNSHMYPKIPEKGSLGASGDLAPLSHMALPIVGLGEVMYGDQLIEGAEALKILGLKPLKLELKEGLALNNGLQYSLALAALNIYESLFLLDEAIKAFVLSLEAILGFSEAFRPEVAKVRNIPGMQYVNSRIWEYIKGSKLVDTVTGHKQDPYSWRTFTQVAGTIYDNLQYVRATVERLLNSVTDNPLVFTDGVVSAGNFHGEDLALAMDFLALNIVSLGTISERRVFALLSAHMNRGLPPFLANKPGDNGLMMIQYTDVYLVAENRQLTTPVAGHSIPTSADQEDYVSLSALSGLRVRNMLQNLYKIIAIEYITAAQAIDFRGPENLGEGSRKIYEKVRQVVPFIKEDCTLYKYIEEMATHISNKYREYAVQRSRC